uniref:Rad60/SUMO-like domain-containing protein n=1 Tax=Spermophilus dauricus TaxID=99837 RepID=A0A8C9Q432_SPEDA
MANEKPKEGVKTENNDHINLKVAGQDGSVVQFKIKRHTPLSKLMKAYLYMAVGFYDLHLCQIMHNVSQRHSGALLSMKG